MSQEKNTLYIVVILIGLLGVILSCCAGMFGGFVAGGWVSSSIARGLQSAPPPYPWPTPEEYDLFPPRGEGLPEEPPTAENPPAGEMAPPGFWKAGYTAGALLVEVNPASPAQKAGLRVGDIIVAVDGQALASGELLSDLIGAYQPGNQVEITFWRPDRERTVKVTLGENREKASRAYLGVLFVPVPQAEETERSNEPD